MVATSFLVTLVYLNQVNGITSNTTTGFVHCSHENVKFHTFTTDF